MNILPCSVPADQHFSSMMMFQQVASKNFQILKNILPRMNTLYQLNEQLERSVCNIELKLTKIERDNENLHYEMRMEHLALEKKIGKIANTCETLVSKTNKLNLQSQTLTKSGKDIRSNNYEQKIDMVKETPNIQTGRKIIFKDQTQRKIFRNSIELSNDEMKQNSKVQFNFKSNVSIECQQKNIGRSEAKTFSSAHDLNSRRSNLKSNNKILKACSSHLIPQKYQKVDDLKKDVQPHQKHDILKKVQNIIERKMAENKQYLASLNQKINKIANKVNLTDNVRQVIQKVKNKLNKKMEEGGNGRDRSSSQISGRKTSNINGNMIECNDKRGHKKILNNSNTKNFENGIFNNQTIKAKISFKKHFQQLEKNIRAKVDTELFNSKVNDLNVRFADLHAIVNKYANKQQTKRAIQYLDNKINSIFEEECDGKKPSIHVVEVNNKGFFRPQEGRSSQIKIPPNTEYLKTQRRYKYKPTTASLHTTIASGRIAQNRFNQDRNSCSSSKQINCQQQVPQEAQNSTLLRLKDISLLKQESLDILEKGKKKIRTKLKKERLIFQYD